MSELRLEHMTQVLEIVKTGSFSKAAENLFISQSNLSLSIKKLEQELGKTLFQRNNRGVELTPFGREYADAIDIIVLELKRLEKLTNAQNLAPSSKLKINNGGWGFVNNAVGEIYMRHAKENVELEVYEDSYLKVMKTVSEGQCDIGVMPVHSFRKRSLMKQFDARNLQYFSIVNTPVTIAVGINNPLYRQKSDKVTRAQLAGMPLVMRCGRQDPYFDLIEELGLAEGHNLIVASGRSTQFEMLETVKGFSVTAANRLVTTYSAHSHRARLLVLTDCPITVEIGWIKRKDYVPTPLALEFLQLLSSYHVE